MKTRTMFVGVSLSIATLVPFTVTAQQQPSQSTIDRELRSLDQRTGEIVKLLQEHVVQRAEDQRLKKLQIAVLALQLRSTAISDIEGRIRTLSDRATAANERTVQLEAEIERINERALDDSIKEGARERLENQKNQIESQIEIASQRAWSLEKEILDLQNELIEKRRNVEALEEIVMQGLSDL